jgi:hypothetical protein
MVIHLHTLTYTATRGLGNQRKHDAIKTWRGMKVKGLHFISEPHKNKIMSHFTVIHLHTLTYTVTRGLGNQRKHDAIKTWRGMKVQLQWRRDPAT